MAALAKYGAPPWPAVCGCGRRSILRTTTTQDGSVCLDQRGRRGPGPVAGGGEEDVSLAMMINPGVVGRVDDDFGSKSRSSRFALRLMAGTGTTRRCAAGENSRIVVMCSSVSSRRASVVELESVDDAVAGRGSAVVRCDEIAQEAAAKSCGRLEGEEKGAMASRIAQQEEEEVERDVRGGGGGGGGGEEFGPGDENGDDVAAVGGHNCCPNDEETTTTTKEPGMTGMRWSMLLSTTALEDAHLSRASSVTDAHVLRRKGRLKEQDGLIEFIISMHTTHSPFQVMEKMENWVKEHLEDPRRSTLNKLVPEIGRFYTPLPLVRALKEYDEFASLSRRRYVPPNFAEIRHVLNIAQVHAIARNLSLLTFDADGTLYADGHHIQRDNKMIGHVIKLMEQGVNVAIVTAAGYPGDAARYEHRFAGLLAAFKDLDLPPRITRLFHVMGGECNYLLRVKSDYHLEFVPGELWKTQDMQEWAEGDVDKLLHDAETALVSAADRLQLPVQLIRKPRAVGVVPTEPTIYEVLEEMALTVQVHLVDSKLPFCAFNGGNDVFVDIGNKSVGLEALMKFLRKGPRETLHVGDRFTVSGNDSATRSKCSILWVANPEETGFFTRVLLREVRLARQVCEE